MRAIRKESMSNDNEIRVGDTVDCSGWARGNSTCSPGILFSGPDGEGEYLVLGVWSNGEDSHYVRPDQITRHVPAAPVVERPASVGGKLASEMTVREHMILEYTKNNALINNSPCATDIIGAIELADLLIAALDKERTP